MNGTSAKSIPHIEGPSWMIMRRRTISTSKISRGTEDTNMDNSIRLGKESTSAKFQDYLHGALFSLVLLSCERHRRRFSTVGQLVGERVFLLFYFLVALDF
jgi:hypothetical protein